jgi:hypothetical protein
MADEAGFVRQGAAGECAKGRGIHRYGEQPPPHIPATDRQTASHSLTSCSTCQRTGGRLGRAGAAGVKRW